MLTISQKQLRLFEQDCFQRFEDTVVKQLSSFTPFHCRALGDAGVRHVVQLAFERACARYGFTNRGPLRLYVELVFLLGIDFDTDPQYPWASDILSNRSSFSQTERADKLFDAVSDYLKTVGGPQNKHAIHALRQAIYKEPDIFTTSDRSLENTIAIHLRAIFPQKHDHVGEKNIRMLIQRGNEFAVAHKATSDTEITLIATMMFMLGHGFAADPHLPWIGRALSCSDSAPSERIQRLYSNTRLYLAYVLDHVEGERG